MSVNEVTTSEKIGVQLSYGTAIVTDLCFGLLSVIGFVLQRRSHLLEEKKDPHLRRSSLLRPLWHLGFWLYVVFGSLASVFNLASLPFFVMVPIGSSRLVYNVVYSHFLLHEDMDFHAFLGTVYVVLAATVIGVCGNVPEPVRDVGDMLIVYRRPLFIAYQCVLAFLGVVLYIVAVWHTGLSNRARGILFATLACLCSSQGGLYAKSGIQLLNLTLFDNSNQFTEPIAFIVVGLMIILSLIGLWFFNKALAFTPTIVTIPITFCISICLAVLNTFVYYDTLTDIIAPWKWALMAISLLYLVYGVNLLATAHIRRQDAIQVDLEEPHGPPHQGDPLESSVEDSSPASSLYGPL